MQILKQRHRLGTPTVFNNPAPHIPPAVDFAVNDISASLFEGKSGDWVLDRPTVGLTTGQPPKSD
jgi:hypothetical protein